MIKPIGDKVVLLPAKKETKTAGGIYIPETAQERPNHAEVIAVGPGTPQWTEMACNPGDTVLYNQFATTEIDINGESYIILQEKDIFAII